MISTGGVAKTSTLALSASLVVCFASLARKCAAGCAVVENNGELAAAGLRGGESVDKGGVKYGSTPAISCKQGKFAWVPGSTGKLPSSISNLSAVLPVLGQISSGKFVGGSGTNRLAQSVERSGGFVFDSVFCMLLTELAGCVAIKLDRFLNEDVFGDYRLPTMIA